MCAACLLPGLAVEQIGLFYSLFSQQHPREQEEAG